MPTDLSSDPILTVHQAKEYGEINDEETAKLLINIVSDKFRAFTRRARITEGSITESLYPLDGNAALVSSRPISATLVSVIESDRSGNSTTFTETADSDSEIIVERARGRIFKSSGFWIRTIGFPSLVVNYTGGWAAVPFDAVAGALAQMKVEQQRLKGLVGADAFGAGGDSVTPETAGLIKTTLDAWKPYRVFMP